jgi:hypothetical protein
MENLPAGNQKSIGDDFSVYLPDRNDPKVRALQDSSYMTLGKTMKNTILISLYGNKGGSLSATYNENGKLISVVENYKT